MSSLQADPRLADPQLLWLAGYAVAQELAQQQTPQARTALFRPIPDDPEGWLRATFPRVLQNARGQPVPFAPHHTALWDWFWRLRPGVAARTFIALWGRGAGKSSAIELGATVCGIFGLRRYVLYICAGQQQADDHVSNIASLLEQAGIDRALNRYGFSRGWRVNRLRTADGFTVDAVGLDTAARGVRIDADRPDLILFDDLDNEHDTPLTTEKKVMTLTRAILPTGSAALAVAGVQNMPNVDGIFAQLADGRAEFLLDRDISGPHPVLADVPETDWWVQEPNPDGAMRIRVLQGTPTWAGQSLADCDALITKIGIRAFQIECQHMTSRLTGTMFQREWFSIVEDWPRQAKRVRWWDFAGTEEKRTSAGIALTNPDYTVGLLVSYLHGQYWILDMQRARLTPKGVEDLVLQTARLDGIGVDIWIGEEPGSSGKAVVEDYQRRVLAGYAVHGKRETGSKAERAKPASSAAEARNIFLVAGGWNTIFLDTHGDVMLFPFGAHDDIVDCLSGAVNVLHKPSGGGAFALRGY